RAASAENRVGAGTLAVSRRARATTSSTMAMERLQGFRTCRVRALHHDLPESSVGACLQYQFRSSEQRDAIARHRAHGDFHHRRGMRPFGAERLAKSRTGEPRMDASDHTAPE